MNTAVIVAAGLSTRLYPLTRNRPKSLLPIDEELILQRTVRILREQGFRNIYIITGYFSEMIEEVLGDTCHYIYNPYYRYCNNMGSLYLAKNIINRQPFLYLHADVLFTEQLLIRFLNQATNSNSSYFLAVDFKETDAEAMKVDVTEDGTLKESSKEIKEQNSAGEWIGLAIVKEPEPLFKEIECILKEQQLLQYDAYALTRLAQKGWEIRCLSVYEESWIEIDFAEDYEQAKRMFSKNGQLF